MEKQSAQGDDKVVHLTTKERAAAGKAVRAKVSLASHGDWAPAADRPDPISLLEEQATSRVPELVPIRHGRMAASAFAFYRGAAYPFAADLGPTPRTDLKVQLCGDAHLANFGGFASPERSLVLDVNDFDETHPGPFEWDIKRLAASIDVAARARQFELAQRTALVTAAVRSYREAMRAFAQMTNLDVWYARMDVDRIMTTWGPEAGGKALKRLQGTVEKAKTKDGMKALAKLTTMVNGERRFLSAPPLLVPIHELFSDDEAAEVDARVRGFLRSYRKSLQPDRRQLLESYRFVDVARKVVGVGSVGTRAWVALLLGRDDEDPLFLQVKEAQASVLEPFLGKSEFADHGHRVVAGQRVMQAASDIFLGWEHADDYEGNRIDYYSRQLWDWKASVDLETIAPDVLAVYVQLCGWTLARAHARSGDRVAIAAYLGSSTKFDDAMARFARAYAEQNDLDHDALVAAIASGRVQAEAGV
jgi:uncharacterized protein (DUF2252 family)